MVNLDVTFRCCCHRQRRRPGSPRSCGHCGSSADCGWHCRAASHIGASPVDVRRRRLGAGVGGRGSATLRQDRHESAGGGREADDGPASETEAARQGLGRRPGRRQQLASGIYHIILYVHGLDARQSLEALARPAAPLAAHSPRPVLVLRCLSCGSCADYHCRLETQCLDSYLRMGDVFSARCCRLASPPQGRLLSLCPDNYSRG